MVKKVKPSSFYVLIAGLSFLISFFVFIIHPNSILDFLGEGEISRFFSDFIMHVQFSEDLTTVYDSSYHACFPPLIYLAYHIISLFIPNGISFPAYIDYRFFGVIFLIVEFLIFSFTTRYLLKKESELQVLLIIFLLSMSSSFISGVIQSANIVLFVMILLAVALELKNSDSKVNQELALVLIAVAAAIKIYPCIFGMFYLAEKNYKKAVRLILYGVFFFFAPFVIVGGSNGFSKFLNNSLAIQQYWSEYSPNSLYNNLINFGFEANIAIVLNIAFAFACILIFLVSKEEWKKCFALVSIIVLCPMWSGQYTTCFYLIPFYSFMNNKVLCKSVDYIEAILFSIIFTSYCISPKVSALKTLVCAIIIMILISIEILLEIFAKLDNKSGEKYEIQD